MRVLHVIPKLIKGGAEQFALNLVSGLNSQPGITSVLVYWEPIFQFDASFVPLTQKISVEVELGIGRINKRKLKPFEAFVREFNPDIIHSHLFQAELVGRVPVFEGVQYFSTVHDNMKQLDSIWSKRWQTIPAAWWERHLALSFYSKSNNRFLAVSKDTSAYLKRVLPEKLAKRVELIYNGVPTSDFLVQERLFPVAFSEIAPLRLINVGSFRPFKGQANLIKAVFNLRQKGVHVELTFLGEGQEFEACKALATELQISKWIHFKGVVHQLQPEYAQHHLYVHASTSESFGLVLIEAMAAGLPVIALDAGGNREVLVNTTATRMLPKDADAECLADAILEWYQKPDLLNPASAEATKVAAEFDFAKTISAVVYQYQLALAKNK
ncbi:MAG: glycosyltransferase [Flavobacteriales bacterium]